MRLSGIMTADLNHVSHSWMMVGTTNSADDCRTQASDGNGLMVQKAHYKATIIQKHHCLSKLLFKMFTCRILSVFVPKILSELHKGLKSVSQDFYHNLTTKTIFW